MSEIVFRRATPGDANAVAAYHELCFRHTYAAQLLAAEFGVPDLGGTRQQIRGWFEPGSGFDTLVAVLDGSPIGHVTISGHQLVHLFVTPAHQGTGLGRRLLTTGEAMITANGYVHLELHARVENVSALAFYQRAGWTVTDRLIRTVEHGISYDEHILRKQTRNRSASGRQPARPSEEHAFRPGYPRDRSAGRWPQILRRPP